MKYMVIETGCLMAMRKQVAKATKEGWKLQGGIAVKHMLNYKTLTAIYEEHNYLQAMTLDGVYEDLESIPKDEDN